VKRLEKLKITKLKRKRRIRAKIKGKNDVIRVCVFRSNKYFYAQAVDDLTGKTLLGITDQKLTDTKDKSKTEKAKLLGNKFADLLKKKKIEKIVFDRSGYKYHGRVLSFAQGMRDSGIKF